MTLTKPLTLLLLLCLLLPCVASAIMCNEPYYGCAQDITCCNQSWEKGVEEFQNTTFIAGGGHPLPEWAKQDVINTKIYNYTQVDLTDCHIESQEDYNGGLPAFMGAVHFNCSVKENIDDIYSPNEVKSLGGSGGGHPMPDWAKPGMENGTHSVYNVTEEVYIPLLFDLEMIDYHVSSNCIEVKISNKTGEPIECIRKQTMELSDAKGSVVAILMERQNELLAEQNALLRNMTARCW